MQLIKLSAIATILFLTSCSARKEYKCLCRGGVDNKEEKEFTVKSVSQKRADAKCFEKGDGYGIENGLRCALVL